MTNIYNDLKSRFNAGTRLGFLVPHLSLIVYLALTLCYSAWAGLESIALPPLKTDEQKLAFLIEIKKQVPKLFADAARYDIDLFTLLDDEAALVEQLKQYPEYAKSFETKKYYDVIITPPKEGLLVQSSSIKPEALDDWRKQALALLDKFGEDLLAKIGVEANVLAELGIKENDNIALILSDFNKILITKAKGKKTVKSKEIDPAIALYNKITSGRDLTLKDRLQGIINSYEDFTGLTTDIPAKADFESALMAAEADEKLALLTELYVLLHRIEAPAPLTHKEAQESLRTLSFEDLIFFSDKDALEPAIKKHLSKVIPESLIKRVVNKISKHVKYYADLRSEEATKVTNKVHLRQVVPAVGIFRGCTGGDCSSQFSFPYPNDPNESVFFILDDNNNTKGYVSATQVMADGALSLYLITVSGNRVSAGDTELIFRGLDQIKKQLGINHIVLPAPANIAALINFPSPRAVYEKYTKGRSLTQINYLLPEIRKAIEGYPSGYNKAKYDYMEKNTQGVLFQPKDQPLKGLEVKLTELALSAIKPLKLAQVANEDILGFMIDLHRSRRSDELGKIKVMDAVQKKITPHAFDQMMTLLEKCQSSAGQSTLKIDEFDDLLRSQLQSLNIPAEFLKSNPQIRWPGVIHCSDAFSTDKIETTAGMIIKNLLESDKPEENITDLLISTEKINHLQETNTFKKLIENLLTNLKSPDTDAQKAAIKKLMKIRPADPKVDLALVEALVDKDMGVRKTVVSALLVIKPADPAAHLALVKALRDDREEVHQTATSLLENIKPTNQAVLLALVETALTAENLRAASILWGIKPTDPVVLLMVVEALKDENIRNNAVSLLKIFKPTDPAVLLALIEDLKDEDAEIRETAASLLGDFKSTNLKAQLALAEALRSDPDEEVKVIAGLALQKIQPTDPAVLLVVAEALKNKDPDVRQTVALILKNVSPTDPVVLLVVAEALKEKDPQIRVTATEILLNIKPTNPAVLLVVAEALKNKDPDIRKRAAWILQSARPTDPAVLLVVAEALKDKDWYIRYNAASFLARIEVPDPTIRSILIETLKDLVANAPNRFDQRYVSELLKKMAD